jgi:hypothetical protein
MLLTRSLRAWLRTLGTSLGGLALLSVLQLPLALAADRSPAASRPSLSTSSLSSPADGERENAAPPDSALPELSAQPEGLGDLKKAASWNWPPVENIEQQLLSYLDDQKLRDADRKKVVDYWRDTESVIRGPALLDRVLTATGHADPRIAELIKQIQDPLGPPILPDEITWLKTEVPGWLQDNIRLAAGRALAQRRLYDEALEALNDLELSQVSDPASLVFYRAVGQHHLLQKQDCLGNITLLLERETELPTRYTQVAQLMSADIQPLKDDTLDEVARLMNDVQRRLDLGRAGKRVRDQEDEIVAKLDKLIDQIEQQMQQQQQQQQQNSGQQQQNPSSQSQPMDETQVAGGSGPGDVDPKKLGDRSGWGNLPPAERQAALQRLTEELPSHYRDVIEGYFRQLAKDNK